MPVIPPGQGAEIGTVIDTNGPGRLLRQHLSFRGCEFLCREEAAAAHLCQPLQPVDEFGTALRW
jgi:hypothetical protein